ncbi:MAG: WG repeat-containing protein [Ekhidna sp.]|uniref:WG repeat-containing protein n=1 Tax=Ekhidna sp. TaxID=2608089 RepID=UPI0032EECEB2
MNSRILSYLTIFLVLVSCRNYIEREQTNYEYHDIQISDTVELEPLIAVTNEEYLQYGSNVAFVNIQGDTIIPFGNFAYFGTDTLNFFANVLLHPNDSTYGRWVGIDRNENILFDLVNFDNGPDYFKDGLTRVQRNGKMGYANERGEVVIPCQYAFARWFENGIAEVTFEAKQYRDLDEHMRVESDSWFEIDKQGNPIKTP